MATGSQFLDDFYAWQQNAAAQWIAGHAGAVITSTGGNAFDSETTVNYTLSITTAEGTTTLTEMKVKGAIAAGIAQVRQA